MKNTVKCFIADFILTSYYSNILGGIVDDYLDYMKVKGSRK